jgi:hypothetical protein
LKSAPIPSMLRVSAVFEGIDRKSQLPGSPFSRTAI